MPTKLNVNCCKFDQNWRLSEFDDHSESKESMTGGRNLFIPGFQRTVNNDRLLWEAVGHQLDGHWAVANTNNGKMQTKYKCIYFIQSWFRKLQNLICSVSFKLTFLLQPFLAFLLHSNILVISDRPFYICKYLGTLSRTRPQRVVVSVMTHETLYNQM